MEDNPDVWPPPISQVERNLQRPRTTLMFWTTFAGLTAGLAYYGLVWRVCFWSLCPSGIDRLRVEVDGPFRLPILLTPQFVIGMGVGLALLVAVSLLLYRRLPAFGSGLGMSVFACGYVFLVVYWMLGHVAVDVIA